MGLHGSNDREPYWRFIPVRRAPSFFPVKDNIEIIWQGSFAFRSSLLSGII
jgi:hypothetical protein